MFLFRSRIYCISSTRDCVSSAILEHLEFRENAHHIFNSLLGVWTSRWNTVARVWYIKRTAGSILHSVVHSCSSINCSKAEKSIFHSSLDCNCYLLHNTTRFCENYLKVAVWFSWWEGHWNWKEITRVSSDAKFHATTFVGCVDDWQLPLKYRMLVIIVVFAIDFSYNWSTDTMPANQTHNDSI